MTAQDLLTSVSPRIHMLPRRDSGRYNAYYFHNVKTKETTWTNPIVGTPKAAPKKDARQVLQGVDPDLAYLDPNLSVALSSSASNGGTVAGGAYAAAGRFNARTGKFEGDPSRNPDFVSDFSRMKRQSNIYFDVDGWEKVRRWWSCHFWAALNGANSPDLRSKKPSRQIRNWPRSQSRQSGSWFVQCSIPRHHSHLS
jgi:hypothetical protein